jgi:hypothetical protein
MDIFRLLTSGQPVRIYTTGNSNQMDINSILRLLMQGRRERSNTI